jgi:predicted nucleotidyltransferase
MGATETRETKIAQEIDSIVRQIVSKYHPIKIILFGSAARGDFERANDLDFLIIKDDVPYLGIDRMRELDEIIDRNIAADMLVYPRILQILTLETNQTIETLLLNQMFKTEGRLPKRPCDERI